MTDGRLRAIAALVLSVLLLPAQAARSAPAAQPGHSVLLDDFSQVGRWQASASDQVQARISRDASGAMCLHYDFGRVSGYAVARREMPLDLPEHYAFTLRLHGRGAGNAFQLKWVDASGDNVWWRHWPEFTPPPQAATLKIRQRQIDFAWGPTGDKVLHHAAAIELVVASGSGGGRGELCFERLEMTRLAAPGPVPVPRLSRSAGGVLLDLGEPREFNGLLWRWPGGGSGTATHQAEVQASDDGRHWRTLHRLRGSRRDWQALWLPDREARFVRLLGAGKVAGLHLAAPAEWPDRNAMLAALAAKSRRSDFPRAFHGQQYYWTLAGVDGGGAHSALVSEDGAIEPRRAGPSVEPWVIDEQGRRLGWSEMAGATHTLREGYLPLPAVQLQQAGFTLSIEAGADGGTEDARLIARYTLHNTGPRPRRLQLALALRPWQVNPPQQFLNTPGGVASVAQLDWRDGALFVDGRRWLQPLSVPAGVEAAAFDQGDALAGAGNALRSLRDPQGLASALLRFPLTLAPDERRSIAVLMPLNGQAPAPPRADAAWADARLQVVADGWRQRLNRVQLTLPPAAQPLHDSLRSALAHVLMSRDGPALQPGTRSYARSWIRDGAMMVASLLRMGEVQAARDFVVWFAGHQFANGKVPCCVDARGADPVAENDSHGEFIFAVAELWRHTGDLALVQWLWPRVDAAAAYIEQLRQSERSDLNRQPGRQALFGTLPASISHEGYSAKPMHSHWDNFWALAGYRDAALLARLLGHGERADQLDAQRAQFSGELAASLARTMADQGISHLPGAAELGDFDPSASTLIFSPAGAEALVPRAALEATWGRYWQESEARRLGQRDWQDYTPYELRSVSAMLRLGWPQRARTMLDFFLHDQRPAGWNQWAEVVGRQPREPRFIGDMPHAWISADFLRSALDLLAYERDADQALVLAAGVPPAWLAHGPVAVAGLSTAHGLLGYRLAHEAGNLRLSVTAGLAEPPGGLWLSWQGRLHRVPHGGQLSLPWAEGR